MTTRSEKDRKKVLVVDPDANSLEEIAAILLDAGYEVTTAATANEALSKARWHTPHVNLVDMSLGNESGTDLVRTLQDENHEPLSVSMSAHTGAENAIQALRAGAFDFIVKPFEPGDLLATLERCFERVRLRQEKKAAQAAIEKKNQELVQHNERLRLVAEAARRLAAHLDMSQLAHELLTQSARILGAEGGSLYVLADGALQRVGVYGPEHAPETLPLPLKDGCLLKRVLATRSPLRIDDVSSTPEVIGSGWTGYQNASALILPIVEDRTGVSGLVSFHCKHVPPFTTQDVDIGSIMVSIGREAIASIRAVTALRESEALYREVFENTSDGLFVSEVTLDHRYKLIAHNPALERMLGISGTRVEAGRHDDEYFPEDILEMVNSHNRQCVAAGRLMSFEGAIDMRAGRLYFQTTRVPLRDAHGRIHRLVGLMRDLTESRRMVESLRQSEEKLKKVFEGSPDSITINRLEDGVMLDANPGFTDIYGYRREEVIGRSTTHDLGIWVSPDDRSRMLGELQARGESIGQWVPFRRKDGSIGYGMVSWRIMDIGGEKCLLSISRDMTKHKLMEEALRASESRFRLLAENSTDIISRLTPEGVYLYVSPACSTVIGHAPEELVGASAYDLLHPDDRTAVTSALSAIQGTTPVTTSYRIRRKDGTYAWFETICRAVQDRETGNVTEVHCASRDIAERMRAREREKADELRLFQAAKLASLGTLVSGIAHEIHNPNNYIRLNSQTLKKFWGDIRSVLSDAAAKPGGLMLHSVPYDEARTMIEELLAGIEEGSARIEKLLLNLRDFARGDVGDLNEPVDLNQVVRSAITLVQNLIQKSTDVFSVRESAKLPTVKGNYHQLEQVVINLLTNACQALGSRDKAITVTTDVEQDGGSIVLTVADQGVGIPSENIPRLVDPFFTTKRQHGGSGLGLAVSYRIVQNHGGTMSFTSKVGKGTVVTVRLPSERSAQ